MRSITTYLLSELIDPERLVGGNAVVIDILRASSTITTALAQGASAVLPCQQIEEARAARLELATVATLSGGERHGIKIEGFDLGNSPKDYHTERVQGKLIIFTTTNGTKALHRSATAQAVYVGCFLNLTAIVERLLSQPASVFLICAGTNAAITQEDCLFAGAVASHLLKHNTDWIWDDATRMCMILYEKWAAQQEGILLGLKDSQGGRNLTRLGLQEDLHDCVAVDHYPILPRWDQTTNRITID